MIDLMEIFLNASFFLKSMFYKCFLLFYINASNIPPNNATAHIIPLIAIC
jgi:hypothetical protein